MLSDLGPRHACGASSSARGYAQEEHDMTARTRLVCAAIGLGAMSMAAVAQVQILDPNIVGFKLPNQIEWKTNPAGTNRSAVLQGDPSKPGPYAMLLQWL